MAQREEAEMDQEVFDKTLEAELGKGTDRRVAEGRAKAAGVRAYRKTHGEPEREQRAPAEREHAAAAAPTGAACGAPPPSPAAAGVWARSAGARCSRSGSPWVFR